MRRFDFIEYPKKVLPSLLIISLLFISEISAAEEFSPSTFKEVYLKNENLLRQQTSNLRVKMHHDRIDHSTISTYLIRNDHFQSQTEYHTEKPLANSPYLRIRSLSKNHFFDIKQQTSKSAFTIIDTGNKDKGRESRWSMPYVLAAYHIMGTPLKAVFEEDSTTIQSIESHGPNGKSLAVSLKVDPSLFHFHEIALTLLPQKTWP